jgi:hypothetical protein
VTENRLLRQQIPGRIRLSDGERKALAEIGKRLGKHALAEVATIVKPEPILAWHRKRIAQKGDRYEPTFTAENCLFDDLGYERSRCIAGGLDEEQRTGSHCC